MSFSGKFTPLQLNALSGLLNSEGFNINPIAQGYQGIYDPTTPPYYTQGSLTFTTVLKDLTAALPLVKGVVAYTTFRGLLNIGTGTIPALGNRRPATFTRTYPGFHDPYPPQEPAVSKYPQYPSPVASPWSATADVDNYAWLTGWTKDDYTYATDFNPAAYSDADEYFKYGYIACHAREAYYEFWNLKTEAKPNHYIRLCRSITQHKSWRDMTNQTVASFKNTKGFLDNAYSNMNDLTTAEISGLSLAFKLFGNDLIALGNTLNLATIDVFGQPDKLLLQLQSVNAITNSLKLALLSTGLTTEEINGILVTKIPATFVQMKQIYDAYKLIQGTDLEDIKIITNCQTVGLTSLADLLDIRKMFPNSFGSITVPRWSLDTISVKVYDFLYVNGGVNTRIQNHSEYLGNSIPPEIAIPASAFAYSMQQIKNIKQMNYQKFAQTVSQLEVTNKGLPMINNDEGIPGDRIAADDALYLTALGSGNSGTYTMVDFIGNISGDQNNPLFENILTLIKTLQTTTLAAIYKKIYDLAVSISTYGLIINRNITSQLTPTTVDMASITGVTASQFIYGAGIPANTYVTAVNGNIITVNQAITAPASIQFRSEEGIIFETTNANTEITRIAGYGGATKDKLNSVWNILGRTLSIQQRAIPFSAPSPTQITEGTNRTDIYDFVRQLENWAVDTQYKEIARCIEKIADLNTLAGQSIVGLMREARNAARIGQAGGVLDNDVSDSLKTVTASAVATVTNGKVTDVTLVSGGSGYNPINPPTIYVNGVLPPNGIAPVLLPVLSQIGLPANNPAIVGSGGLQNAGASVIDVTIANPGANLPENIDLVFQDPPAPDRRGFPIVPGVIPNYEVINTIPPDLVSEPSSSFTENEAIEDVTICNCECWIM
jgi:hypothetical protein